MWLGIICGSFLVLRPFSCSPTGVSIHDWFNIPALKHSDMIYSQGWFCNPVSSPLKTEIFTQD